MKKVLSLILSFAMLASSFAFSGAVFAQDYTQTLKDAGFSDAYIPYLTALHNAHPNWTFKALQTNLDWQTAVNGERSTHSKQLVQRKSSISDSYYCQCSSCLQNGDYVVQESSNWISASESAVKYYMDPRNWMNDQYIWQFESTEYDSSQTKTGVEAILSGTFMSNSLISYKTTSGSSKTYDQSTTYSDAIITAAQSSKLSAYYLASKIRQEIGGASATAGGASGTVAPFQGIYNYYNIGANTGASDGLAWAAGYLKTNVATTLYSNYENGVVSGTTTPLGANQYMTWRADSGNYYKVRLYTESNGAYTEGATGYVLKSDCRTTYFNNGRPWSNPYKSIIYGAAYIATDFSTQNTGYLQKFNVTPASSNLFTHEYMANVQAASAEASTTYNAKKSAGIVDNKSTFIIPVYLNMPSAPCDVNDVSNNTSPVIDLQVKGLTLTARTTTTLTYTWNTVSGASSYYVYFKNNTTGTSYNKKVTTNSVKLSNLTGTNEYTVKVKAYVGSVYGPYSSTNTKHTLPTKVTDVKTKARSATTITLSWNKKAGADGYYIYQYSPSKKKSTKIATVSGDGTTSYKVTGLKSGTLYYYYVSAFTVDSKTKESSKSSKLTTGTKSSKPKATSLKKTSSKKIKLKWNSTKCSGYQIQYSTSKTFKSNNKTINVKSSAKSKIISVSKSKKTYYVRIRSYKTINGTKVYSSYSSTLKVKS